MIQPIMHDEAFLQQQAELATLQDLSIANDLLDTLRAHTDGCVGMAANMIGHNKAIIAFDHEGTYMIMLNPEIIRQSHPYETEEGCLSLQGMRKTIRYRSIRVQWQDMKLEQHTHTFLGFSAQIIQHEIDHLHGILI